MMTSQPLRASLDLSSRFENIEVAERTLVDLCAQAGCGPEEQYWLVTALREAIANAIRHGNRENPNLRVRLEFIIEDGTVTMQVADQGEGFEPTQVPDPTAPENLMRPCGRGIFYMRQFMTRVDFDSAPGGGTRVTMVRELPVTRRGAHHEE